MKLHSFTELATRIVHLSTRSGKPIPVSWNGNSAFTTTNSVNIPALPSGSTLTDHQFSIWLGYVIHEGPGHQTHSDLSFYELECKRQNNQLFSYLFNILEDIRIENATIARYPGDRKYLDSTHQFVDDKIPLEKSLNPDILGLIYKHVYVNFRNLNTNRIFGSLQPGPIAIALEKLPLCKSTSDCAKLAKEILDLLPNDPNNKEEEEEEEEAGGGLSGDESQNNAGSENSDSNSNPQNNGSNSKSNSPPQNNEQSNSKPGSSDDLQSSASNWNSLIEIKNSIQKLAKEINSEFPIPNQDQNYHQNNNFHSGSAIFPPANISYDRIFIPSKEDFQTYLQTRAELAPQILALKKMFRIHLQSRDQKSWLRGLEEGQLDKDRLYITATGSSTIFRDRTSKPLINTAISLMIDLSGSMNIEIARSTAIILAEALASIPQIKLSISGFTTNNRGKDFGFNLPPNSGRAVGMDIFLFKDFSEPYIKSRAKLGAIQRSNYTPLGDAYGKALEQLIPRSEPRKIIFLITDGMPEFPKGANHSDYLLMSQIKSKAKKLQIETIGLGIGNSTQFLSEYVEKYIPANDLQTLPTDLLKILKQTIH